jgi:hypothetical protein
MGRVTIADDSSASCKEDVCVAGCSAPHAFYYVKLSTAAGEVGPVTVLHLASHRQTRLLRSACLPEMRLPHPPTHREPAASVKSLARTTRLTGQMTDHRLTCAQAKLDMLVDLHARNRLTSFQQLVDLCGGGPAAAAQRGGARSAPAAPELRSAWLLLQTNAALTPAAVPVESSSHKRGAACGASSQQSSRGRGRGRR